MATCPGEPGLASFIEAKDDGSGDDNWSYKSCKAPVKSSPPTNQHPTFYSLDDLHFAQPTVSLCSVHKIIINRIYITNTKISYS